MSPAAHSPIRVKAEKEPAASVRRIGPGLLLMSAQPRKAHCDMTRNLQAMAAQPRAHAAIEDEGAA